MHCDGSHLNMQTISVNCQLRYALKKSVRKKRRKAEPLTLTAKKYVYNKTT